MFSDRAIIWAISLSTALGSLVHAREPNPADEIETEMSLEDVLNIQITSVSKHAQKLFETPAAAFVITGEDIKRSGARTFAEALRMAPGISVARQSTGEYAVGARGLGDRYSPYLLVLIDGRSVWAMQTGGVEWGMQHYLLEDIDRIEVIRGPGGTMWGANAVNGVINVITKPASETLGGYIEGGGGTELLATGGARYGAKVAEDTYLRGYATGHGYDNPAAARDGTQLVQGGYRADWEKENYTLSLHGDYFSFRQYTRQFTGRTTPPFVVQTHPQMGARDAITEATGGNTVLKYHRPLEGDSDLKFQVYYDRVEPRYGEAFEQLREDYAVEMQHRLELPGRQVLTYGGGYRYLPTTSSDKPNDPVYRWNPTEFRRQIVSLFAQDELTLIEDRLKFIAGVKAEHHDDVGWEFMPNGRLLWLVTEKQTAWAAVSRAVQVPTLGIVYYSQSPLSYAPVLVPVGPGQFYPVFLGLKDSPDLESQSVIAYEAGYRIKVKESLSIDLAGFYNHYHNAFGAEPQPLIRTPTFGVLEYQVQNTGELRTFGGEIAAEYRVLDDWRATLAYSYIDIDMNLSANVFTPGDTPRHQISLRNSFDLPAGFQLDVWSRFVDELPLAGPSSNVQPVDSYFDMDVRLAWRASKRLGLAVVGQNLIEGKHYESRPPNILVFQETMVPRSVYAMAWYRF